MSQEILAGFLSTVEAHKVIEAKIKMVVIGATQQSQARLEELLEKQMHLWEADRPSELSGKEKAEIWFLEQNLKYLREQVFEYQIRLSKLWNGIEVWNSKNLLRKYWALGLMCNKIEKQIVADYGVVCNLGPLLEWTELEERYRFLGGLSKEQIETFVEQFESADINDWDVEEGEDVD